MDYKKKISKVSEAPTLPAKKSKRREFDVADLYREPSAGGAEAKSAEAALDEKLRQAYYWITNNAIITPFYDIEYQDGPSPEYQLGDTKAALRFPSDQSYSSFVLLPILTLAARRKCLFIGGPGRGKTASAVLMGVLAGYSLQELKRAIQHGQPQMTVSDLLGNPLPADLMKAESMESIRIAWRKWLSMRVKIIDEYNRIPTRTQSALLTVMADNYAELLDQVYQCPEAAWYLTANDDAGGGTYQVIEALRDRIDVVVRALHFNTRFIGDLLARVEAGVRPEEMVPPETVFTEAELDRAQREILDVEFPEALLRRLEHFAAQFEFMEPAAVQLEYRTKDNVRLSGADLKAVASQETGKSRARDIGGQTANGLSVRAIMTCLVYTKALSWFRGRSEVSIDDLRNMLPFVLHDKLAQNQASAFFDEPGNAVYRTDRVSWIRRLWDLSCAEYDQLGLDNSDPVADLSAAFERGLDGVPAKQVEAELVKIEKLMESYQKNRKLHGPMFDDVLKLKYLHQRYTNYLRWLNWKG
jgi:MoxR-like ATPase